jgi:hypothetical protein
MDRRILNHRQKVPENARARRRRQGKKNINTGYSKLARQLQLLQQSVRMH